MLVNFTCELCLPNLVIYSVSIFCCNKDKDLVIIKVVTKFRQLQQLIV